MRKLYALFLKCCDLLGELSNEFFDSFFEATKHALGDAGYALGIFAFHSLALYLLVQLNHYVVLHMMDAGEVIHFAHDFTYYFLLLYTCYRFVMCFVDRL